jgi:hypothetical protein
LLDDVPIKSSSSNSGKRFKYGLLDDVHIESPSSEKRPRIEEPINSISIEPATKIQKIDQNGGFYYKYLKQKKLYLSKRRQVI